MMYTVRSVHPKEKELLRAIADIHVQTFKGFFLSSLHIGFLRLLYRSFAEYRDGELLIAFEGEKPVGFLAYSCHTSGIYKYMLIRHFFLFFWYSFLSFLKNPIILPKMFSALKMPMVARRDEKYVKIFSIGVQPEYEGRGVGSQLVDALKDSVDFDKYQYITLETDAVNNDKANNFYRMNQFRISYVFETDEGRLMNKYHYRRTT